MKFLRYYPDNPSAQIAKGVLSTHGIDSFVGNTNDTFAVKGVRFMVPEEQFEEAKRILEEAAAEITLPDDWEPPAEGSESESES